MLTFKFYDLEFEIYPSRGEALEKVREFNIELKKQGTKLAKNSILYTYILSKEYGVSQTEHKCGYINLTEDMCQLLRTIFEITPTSYQISSRVNIYEDI